MDDVSISDKKPTFNRLQSSKLIVIWLEVCFETNKRNTNLDHISNVKHTYLLLNRQKRFVGTKLCELDWLKKTLYQLAKMHFYFSTKIC
jgi:hypothetical protein